MAGQADIRPPDVCPTDSSSSKKWLVVCCMVIFGGIFLGTGIWIWRYFARIENAKAIVAKNNCRQIMLAIKNYETIFQKLPAPAFYGSDGKPAHSWRTLVSPYLEFGEINPKDKIDINDGPWDQPPNKFKSEKEQPLYQSPRAQRFDRFCTNFVIVVGPGTIFENKKRPSGQYGNVRFPTQKVAVIIELPDSDIRWAEPRDITVDNAVQIIQSAPYDIVVGFSDASAEFISRSTSESEIRAMFSPRD